MEKTAICIYVSCVHPQQFLNVSNENEWVVYNNTLSNLAHWTSNSTNDHLPSLILVDELLIDLSIWQYIFTVNDTTETN